MFLVQKANLSSPFRSTTNKSSHISKPYLLAASLFDEKVLLHLKTLDLTKPSSNSKISLSWLSAAVSFLSTVHTEAEAQISNLKLKSKSKSEADDYQALYMDYSIKVLDLCNIISSGVNRLTERRRLMNFSLRLLNFTDKFPSHEKLNKAKDAIIRSVNNTDEQYVKDMKDVKDVKDVKDEKEKSLRAKALIEELSLLLGKLPRGNTHLIRRSLYALGVLTVFIGSAMVNVLYGEHDVIKLSVPDEFLWADSVNGVQERIVDLIKVKEKESVIVEVDDVAKQAVVVCDVVQAVVDGGDNGDVRVCLEEGVKELALLTGRFSDGVEGLTNGVNGLFDTVMKTRNGCLDDKVWIRVECR